MLCTAPCIQNGIHDSCPRLLDRWRAVYSRKIAAHRWITRLLA